APLLPDRFAVIAIRDGTLRNLNDVHQPPRFVTWSQPVTSPLPIDPLADPGTPTWLTSFDAAEAAGMAVRIPLAAGAAPIDTLLVVGVRGGPAALADLLAAHGFTGGLEVLPDGAPTNNSDTVRAAHSSTAQSDAARAVLGGGTPPAP